MEQDKLNRPPSTFLNLRDAFGKLVRRRPPFPGRSYESKIDFERRFFEHNTQVHDLPPIFHYWSNKFIRPMHEEFGFTLAEDMYGQYLSRAAAAGGAEPPVFVSLGSGNCDLEIRLARTLSAGGLSEFVIECVDLNPAMLDRGNEQAKVNGLQQHLAFVVSDLNRWKAIRQYTGVIAHQSLHHVLELESLFDEIKKCLLPHGCFVTSDMIGRNGHLRWPEAMREVQRFWRELPLEYRWNTVLERHEEEFIDHDCSSEGFEGVRAQDVLPLLVDRFEFELFIAFGNVILPFIDRRFGPHFDAGRDWDRDFIDRVHSFDEDAILSGRLSPGQMLAVMTPERCGEHHYSRGLTPAMCIRRQTDFGNGLPERDGTSLAIETTSVPPVTPEGAIYSAQLSAAGGIPPHKWSATGLPPGLVLEDSGRLHGRAKWSGIFNPTVTVEDSASPPHWASQRFTFILKDVPEPLTINAAKARSGALAGSQYRQILSAAGGRPPYSWAITEGVLPGGLTLQKAGRAIEGKPVRPGTFPFTVQVTDSASESVSMEKTIVVHSADVGCTRLVLPHLACGGGWKTSVLLTNSAIQPVSVIVRFFSTDGSPLQLPLTVTTGGSSLASRSAEIEDIVEPERSCRIETMGQVGPDHSGWVEIRCMGSLQVEATFAHDVFGAATVPLKNAAVSSFHLPFVHAGGTSTGIGLANPNHSEPVTVAVKLRGLQGEFIASKPLNLPPAGQTSFSLGDHFPEAAGRSGVVEFTCAEAQEIAGLGLQFHPSGHFQLLEKLLTGSE